jgi:hypothetical protein
MLPLAGRMANSRGAQRIGDILLHAGLIDQVQLKSGLAQLQQFGGRLPKVLNDLGLADEDQMADAIAKSFDLDRISLGTIHRDANALKLLQPSFCKEHSFFPVALRDRTLTLAVSDPTDLPGLDEAMALAGGRVELAVATEQEIQFAIEKLYFNRTPRILSNKARKAVTRDLPIQDDGALQLDTDAPPSPEPAGFQRGATFDFDTSGSEWTPELKKRLEEVKENQKKTTFLFRAIRELLFEKGLLEE